MCGRVLTRLVFTYSAEEKDYEFTIDLFAEVDPEVRTPFLTLPAALS